MKAIRNLLLICLILNIFVCRGAIFTVSNTNDSGSGSLRAAMMSANATPSPPHSVVFQIPASDPGYNSTTGV